MKRFIVTLLIALLVVSSFAVTAFAAGTGSVSVSSKTAKPGEEVTLSVTVSGEFNSYDMTVYVNGLELKAISGVASNVATGAVSFADPSGENITGHSFSVTVKVPNDAKPGFYPVGVNVDFVADRNTEDLSVSVSNGGVKIECDHAWDEGTVTKEPTCTETGVKTYKCTKGCGATWTETIDALGHKDGQWEVTKEATCKEAGTKVMKCTRCGEVIKTETIAKLEHTWDKGTVTKEPTCTETGVKTYKCTKCGETRTETIDALGHDWSGWEAVDAEYHAHICRTCGEHADKEAHTFEWKIDTKPGADHTGLKHEECHKCGYKRNQGTVIPAVPGLDDVPQTGDITPYIALGFLSMISMVAAAAYVIKRKFAK